MKYILLVEPCSIIFEMNRFDKFPQECDSAEAMILLKTGRQTQ